VPYIGRFAPSPTGPLHAGSLVAALASFLDARAHGGTWLLRIEDIDAPRVRRGAVEAIVDTLWRLGMRPDGDISFQSRRLARYESAFDRLRAAGLVYPCGCTRAELADSRVNWHGAAASEGCDLVYPGTCRSGLPAGRSARSWRVRVDSSPIDWVDRNGSVHSDQLEATLGDFVVHRADGMWAYQLAVVVDDAEQRISDVVRGCDLESSTSRQIRLQRLLGFPTPHYLHIPVVLTPEGQKLSKQTGAAAIDPYRPLDALNAAMIHLGLEAVQTDSLETFWPTATERWARSRWMNVAVPPPAAPYPRLPANSLR
jgi:glutamyl-Q tRNA(Asp) synthetase